MPTQPKMIDAARTGTGIWGTIAGLFALLALWAKVIAGDAQIDTELIALTSTVIAGVLALIRGRLAVMRKSPPPPV